MSEEEPLIPDSEYCLTRDTLGDVVQERLAQAAVFVGNQALTALWVGRPAPREFEDKGPLDASELRLIYRMGLVGGTVIMWADLNAPGLQHSRRYEFDNNRIPDGLNQDTALGDEQVRLVLGRSMAFDLEAAQAWRDSEFIRQDTPTQE